MDSLQEMNYKTIGFHAGPCPENNVITFLHRHVTLFPERIALQWVPGVLTTTDHKEPFPHHSVSFKELLGRINRVAGGLKSLGINKGDRVLVFLPMSELMYIVMVNVLILKN